MVLVRDVRQEVRDKKLKGEGLLREPPVTEKQGKHLQDASFMKKLGKISSQD